MAYDGQGNLTTLTLEDESTQVFTYDATFNVPDSFTDELSRATTFAIDEETGDVLEITRDARTTAMTWTLSSLGK